MQTMSEAWVTASQSQRYYVKAEINGTAISDNIDNLKYTGYCNGEGALTIGNACSGSVTFEILNPTANYTGQKLDISYGLDINGTMEYIKLGSFTCVKPDVNGNRVSYTAYDDMIALLEKEYVTTLTFPTTDIAIIDDIATQNGLSYNLPTGYTTHTISSLDAIYTMRELLGYMAMLNGFNVFIDRNGDIAFKWYETANYTLTDDLIYSGGADIKSEGNFVLSYIICQIQTADGMISQLTSGSGDMGIGIENPFMTQTILDEILTKIGGFTYAIGDFNFKGDFRLDLGDVITVTTGGTSYSIPLMMISHSCDGGLVDNIASYGETAAENSYGDTNPTTQYQQKVAEIINALNNAMIERITIAGGTATDYITEISGGGIKVHDVNAENTDYTAITSDGMTVYADGVKIAKFGGSSVELSETASATGTDSYAEGSGTTASGNYSHAEGYGNTASDNYSHIEGFNNTSSSSGMGCNHTEGSYNSVNGEYLHTEGYRNTSAGDWNHIEGGSNELVGSPRYVHIEGCENEHTNGYYSHIEGLANTSSGTSCHIEGLNNTDAGSYNHTEGNQNTNNGEYNHIEGDNNAIQSYNGNTYNHIEGKSNSLSIGKYCHIEGYNNNVVGFSRVGDYPEYAHAEGGENTVRSTSHAEGTENSVYATNSHAEGSGNTIGDATAESDGLTGCHIEGSDNTITANASYSHAEGRETSAQMSYCHAEGFHTVAGGLGYNHAEGSNTSATGLCCHSAGDHTVASGIAQTVVGKYNDNKSSNLFEVGNGTENARSNAFEVSSSGVATASGGFVGNLTGTATNSNNTYNAVTNPSSSTTYQVPFVTSSTTSGQRQNKVNDGLRYMATQGTASAEGVAKMVLGNGTASGTAGNKRGSIRVYGSSSYYTDVVSKGDLGANNTVYFPRSNGYIPVFESGAITSGTLNGGDTTTSLDVTFARPFKVAPHVMITPVANTRYHERTISVTGLTVTTTGFTVSVVMNGYASTQDLTTSRRIEWLAVGI